MNVIIVSHPDRVEYVRRLQAVLPVVATVVDTISAWSGHRAALRLATAHRERVAIMEDDAIPVRDFARLASMWGEARPDELLSFYLGTGRPPSFQPMIQQRLAHAQAEGDAEIRLPTLIHGVCYSIPAGRVRDVSAGMDAMARHVREADYAIGAAWGAHVCYPIESLVQHRDETPVERHFDGQRRVEKRVARQLAGPLMFEP